MRNVNVQAAWSGGWSETHRGVIQTPVFWQPFQHKHTWAWMKGSVEQMVLWEALRVIQYRKRCCHRWPLLPPLFLFFCDVTGLRRRRRSQSSPCQAVIILRFYICPNTVYFCGSQYRWRVMNKLRIRVKAKSYTEVTCFLSAILKRAEQQGMCPASPNGPIINGQPSESAWIIYNPPPPCWAAQSEVLHFKQRGRHIRCAILSAPSHFHIPASLLISILLENRWRWSKWWYSYQRAPSERAAVPQVVSRGTEKTQREPLNLLPVVRDPAAAFVSSHHRGRRSKTGALLQYLDLWWFISVSSGLKSSSTLRSGFILWFFPRCPPPVLLWPSPIHAQVSNISGTSLIFVPQLWCLLTVKTTRLFFSLICGYCCNSFSI